MVPDRSPAPPALAPHSHCMSVCVWCARAVLPLCAWPRLAVLAGAKEGGRQLGKCAPGGHSVSRGGHRVREPAVIGYLC